jgi:hypothetical protein
MKSERTKQTFKLRVLAFVLALALLWYSLNPAPAPLVRRKRDDELPDEKKRHVEPRSMQATLPLAITPWREAAKPAPSPNIDEDDFEWPEFIDG